MADTGGKGRFLCVANTFMSSFGKLKSTFLKREIECVCVCVCYEVLQVSTFIGLLSMSS